MMLYKEIITKTGVSFMVLLFVLSCFNCKEFTKKKGIQFEISSNANLNDTIIVCKINRFDDLLNGSSKLVIDTLIINNEVAFYNPDLEEGTLLRFNFYPSDKSIDIPGGIISMGSKSNYIFSYYYKNDLTKISIKDSNIQNYQMSSKSISNNEYYKIHKGFEFFRTSEDDLIKKVIESKNKKIRDSILYYGKNALIENYNTCIDSLMSDWASYKSDESKILGLNYFLSPFVKKNKSIDFIRKSIDELNKAKLNNSFVSYLESFIDENNKEIKYLKIKDYLIDNYNLNPDSIENKIIVLSFWASWCKPCRMYNKFEFKELYNNFKNTCEIISISIDKDKSKWKKAEKEDNILWKSFIDPKASNSEIIKILNIKSIPYELFIFPNKTVKKYDMSKNIISVIKSNLPAENTLRK